MITPFINLPDRLDWDLLSETGIDLLPEQIDRAIQLSHQTAMSAPIDGSQDLEWQVYLNALALFGVEQWLEEWAPELGFNTSQCSLFQPNTHRCHNTITHVQVGRFDLCLIVTIDRDDPTIAMPKIILNTTQTAQFYVLVELLEEQMQAMVYGYLSHEQLVLQCDRLEGRSVSEMDYAVPLNAFNLEPTGLLLELRCLEPVMNEAAQAAPQPPILGEPERINVAVWLGDRLDEAALALSWVLMPAFATAGGMRTIGNLFTNLEIAIPPEARAAYQDFQVGTVAVRLYAVTWVLALPDDRHGWSLLTVLSGQSGQPLPLGIQLQIRDTKQLLSTQVLQTITPDAALYAQVGGEWNENFMVSIQLATGETFTLSPFTFTP
jgi:Protein of unknown function (DUF1822)